ncbi:hypothetical protein Zm00014a_010218 [Zea mays]|uniref:Uncharacterized protein n=2 Tax=Zea mays TaxID=4577 RepID=A0A8J8XK42_MAIZE|nr:hypothetical protein ZEAMMB73_Zm00001d004298 [Zea mays]PWZ39067.1 hypothetical protein Zm00014a_010218 [Zea mays]
MAEENHVVAGAGQKLYWSRQTRATAVQRLRFAAHCCLHALTCTLPLYEPENQTLWEENQFLKMVSKRMTRLLFDEIANVRERLFDFLVNEMIDIGGSCRVEGASYN